MKTLLLMRHAKSSWDDEALPDHDRPLNTRGERDAPRMAKILVDAGRRPDLIVSSTALRARTTALAVAEAFEWQPEVRLKHGLYMASAGDILSEVERTPGEVETLMLVGHNPGTEDLVSDLARMRQAMPTSAVAQFSVEQWSEAGSAAAQLVTVWRPKEVD